MDTQKQAKFSVYLKTQKVNSNILRSSRGKLSTGRLSNGKGGRGPNKIDEQSAQYMATVGFVDEEGNLPEIQIDQHTHNSKTNLTQRWPLNNLNTKNRIASTCNMKSTNLIGKRPANCVLMKNSSVSPNKTSFTTKNSHRRISRQSGVGARVTQKTISTNLTMS